MQTPRPSFTILALAALGPGLDKISRPKPVAVTLDTLDQAVAALVPEVFVPLPRSLGPTGGLSLRIRSIKDFRPDSLVRGDEYLASVEAARRFLVEAEARAESPREVAGRLRSGWPALPLDFEPHGESAAGPKPARSKDLDDILAQVALPESRSRTVLSGGELGRWRLEIEELLASILKIIFENNEFRTCEAAWRGVETLVKQGPVKAGSGTRLLVVPAGPDDIEDVLDSLAVDLINDPPNLILLDLKLDSSARSMSILEKAAGLAEMLLSPTICWIGAGFFQLEDWSGLNTLSYLKHHLQSGAYAKWRRVAESGGGRWLGVTLNRFLGRPPYGPDFPSGPVRFTEERRLWLSPVWAAGALAALSHDLHGWPCRFTDHLNVRLTDLALAEPAGGRPSPTEMDLGEDRLAQFLEAGLSPLVGALGRDTAFIPRETSLAGGSLKEQLFFSRLLGALFWIRDHLAEEIEAGGLADNLKEALALWWESTGHPAPSDLEVKAAGEKEGRISLNLGLTPQAAILPGGGRVEFTFDW